MDHLTLLEELSEIYRSYPQICVEYMGESVLGKGIPVVRMGEGERVSVYVAGMGGNDHCGTALLLRWIKEYVSLLEGNRKICRFTADYLFQTRTVYVIPMLNPDGIDYACHGPEKDHVLYERVRAMNGGSDDFSAWRANGRGVDLRYNFREGFDEHRNTAFQRGILGGASEGFGGESPESEPEIGHFCNFLRYIQPDRLVLHVQEGERGLRCSTTAEREQRASELESIFSRMTGIGARGQEDALSQFIAHETAAVGCSLGLGVPRRGEDFALYGTLREFLFSAPTMI